MKDLIRDSDIQKFISEKKKLGSYYEKLFNSDFTSFLTNHIKRNTSFETFIHRSKPVDIEESYVPLSIVNQYNRTTLFNIEEVFLQNNAILIEGSAGCGKSTLLRFVLLRSIQTGFKIPIIIPLRYLATSSTVDIMKLAFGDVNSDLFEEVIIPLLKDGAFLFLLDGLEEVPHMIEKDVINHLNETLTNLSPNNFIVTSRPSIVNSQLNMETYHVEPFDKHQINDFIRKLDIEIYFKERLVVDLEKNDLHQVISSPLLLSVYILTFSQSGGNYDKVSSFYRHAFDALYNKHDAISKAAYDREKRSGLHAEDFQRILETLAAVLYFNKKYEFHVKDIEEILAKMPSYNEMDLNDIVYDLTVSAPMLVRTGYLFSFIHVTFQEYFVSSFISRIETDTKEGLYIRIRENLYLSDSLIRFLSEQDQYSFSRYFVIPEIKKFKSQNFRVVNDSVLSLLKNEIKNEKSESKTNIDQRDISLLINRIEKRAIDIIDQQGLNPSIMDLI